MNIKSQPFDGEAARYDETFTRRLPGRWFRDTVWSTVEAFFQKGDHALDLGCGTGEDAIWLAKRGLRVTAMDHSREMLRAARRKAEQAGVIDSILFVEKDLALLSKDTERMGPSYDGVLSNFGALNCLEDLKPLAEFLSRRIRPGGSVCLVLMGPLCPWEILWFLCRGRGKEALRRFSAGRKARVGDMASVRVWYPSPRRVRLDFAPAFRPIKTVGIGTLVPPPYLDGMVEKARGFFEGMWKLESRLGRFFPWTWLNDHYLILLKRV